MGDVRCLVLFLNYIGIKNPLHARQAPLLVSRRAVLFKIVLAWLLSAVITSPLTIMGSLSAFFCPMVVMLSSYVLTVRLLRRKAKFYEDSTHNYTIGTDKESTEFQKFKRQTPSSGLSTFYN
ncbi:unnamed protein product, partial [Oppiella nova]